MLNEKIEFYGEILSMLAIANKIGVSRDTLIKHYEITGDIYKAEEICKKILQEKESSLVEYNGENLAIQTIAKAEGIKDAKTLKKYYEQTGNIYKAIQICKMNKIEYNGEMLTINAIATRLKLKGDTIKKYYIESGDIYSAVNKCLELRKAKEDTLIEYNGEMLTYTQIARKAGLSKTSLRKYYEKTGNIYEAIEEYYKKQKEFDDTKIDYNGERKFLRTIAKDENVAETTLDRYYKRYGNIEKAVYMAKVQRRKTQKLKIRNSNLGINDLSIVLGIKESELLYMLNSGMTIEEIKAQKPKRHRNSPVLKEKLTLPNGKPLLDYCIENKLNYSCIYYAINTYGKSVEEAIDEYKQNGQKIPQKWIFEKYDILLKHLLLQNNVNSQRLVSYMQKENISMNDAIEEYILRKNAKSLQLDYEWVNELYSVLTNSENAEIYDNFKERYSVNDTEETCVIKSLDDIESIQRKLLLYEIADAFDEFNENEKGELLRIYNVTDAELETIFFDFYKGFENKISNTMSNQIRKNQICEIAKKWFFLSESERKETLDYSNITTQEKLIIEKLSGTITKYITEIHKSIDKENEGVNIDGE